MNADPSDPSHTPHSSYTDWRSERNRFARPGGTSGGIGAFLLGLGLFVAGAYLIMNQVYITGGYWGWFGGSTFGLTLAPLLIGIGVLFFDGRSAAGWLLVFVGVVIVVAGVLVNLHLYFRATTLYETLLMFGLFAAGLGLMARSLREQ